MPSGVSKTIHKYWWEGFSGGLLMLDGVVLMLFLCDLIRFQWTGLSLTNAVRTTIEAAREGKSVVPCLTVFAFFMIALPMLCALIGAASQTRNWGVYFRTYSGSKFALHTILSVFVALFTATAITAEVLSGFAWDVEGERASYRFVSWWLVIVFLGQPVWAFY